MKPIHLWVPLLVLLGVLFLAEQVFAQQPPCAPFEQWRVALTKVKQKLIGIGPVGETHVVMFWATQGGTHWTILNVDTSGRACVMAAGADWDQGRIPAIGEREA